VGEAGLSRGLSRGAERALLAAILLAALAVRAWGLEQNGWGAAYYSAAARSMAADAHSFLFAAFDRAGFISVDKPPLALWLQVASVKLLGYEPAALLLPQVLAGVAATAVLYLLSRPAFGPGPALLAAFLFAMTPGWVAVNRTNNVDSALLLVLLLAAWALLKSLETGAMRWWLVAMAAVGAAFNVKMLAGFVVLPALAGTWLLCSVLPWRRRLAGLAAGGAVLVAVSAPWFLLVELTPADQRPWVGSSRTNSVLELALGHNAASRFARPETAVAPPRPAREAASVGDADEPDTDTRSLARALAQRLFVRTPTGLLRPAYGLPAAQFAWLLPLPSRASPSACGDGNRARAAPAVSRRPRRCCGCSGRSPTGSSTRTSAASSTSITSRRSRRPSPCWPPRASRLSFRDSVSRRRSPSSFPRRSPRPRPGRSTCSGARWDRRRRRCSGKGSRGIRGFAARWDLGTLAAALGLGVAWWRSRQGTPAPALASGSLALGAAALLVLPAAWTASAVLLPAHGVMPSADLYRLAVASYDRRAMEALRLGQAPDTTRLVAFLRANRRGERFLVSTTTTHLAAPIIIETSEPVLARGGFLGLDGAVTPERLEGLVRAGELRFAMTGDLTAANRRMGARVAARPVDEWIRAHGVPVPGDRWRPGRGATGVRLHDLRPGGEWAAPP
jgi:4-amino-4-deoxy-L-arabinose transferase-like glycosyltransferase